MLSVRNETVYFRFFSCVESVIVCAFQRNLYCITMTCYEVYLNILFVTICFVLLYEIETIFYDGSEPTFTQIESNITSTAFSINILFIIYLTVQIQ